ncbi:hypothetical protein [Halobacillus litoralis]|uniref:Uncharacterized protein n=1 Tax=Halobacillus litoralis TaxID=45668 RepID=A0A410MCR3_9BACI|nr:hypothetical protein [Halobacillus litoralis]QAS52511.1 hypothetical protein HLI_09910 [Halobacillus litoralis]
MSDIMDRKLKKMNQDVKYCQVPFDRRHMQRSVLHSLKRKRIRKVSRLKKIAPLPIFMTLLFTGLHLFSPASPPASEQASLLPEKSTAAELKSVTHASKASHTNGQSAVPPSNNTSMMVRETYVIHEDEQFVQTGNRIPKEQLGEVVGTIEHKPPTENQNKLESVTAFLPKTKIYKIKGSEGENSIAIQSWRSTGVGSTSISKQGYFIFEKSRPMKNAQ